MESKITKLYDEYREGQIDRRTFLKKMTLLTGSAAAALSILPALGEINSITPAQQDDDLVTEFITYPAPKTEMKAFMAHPKKDEKVQMRSMRLHL